MALDSIVSLRLDPDTHAELAQLAHAQGRTIANLTRLLVNAGLRRYAERRAAAARARVEPTTPTIT